MEKLNLPEYELVLKETSDGKEVWDPVRKKYLVLTPEEWVRQNFLNFLINDLGYPLSLIRNEGGLKYNGRQKRTDILAYGNDGLPLILVECKATTVKISSDVFEQASVYNKELKSKYLIVTNGLQHFCCEQNFSTGDVTFLESIPKYQ
ncbi:type I restriction enzyme HsdR N-terminal domain-containing protein [Reichenbachiella versicolor]|uniref:type I restriction enzyme HsdR N-terminal domain-containing protein n=1 Tax=Reichenbachiella versicolor TaxID=1821036 RepID=UPI000D6E8AD8|nr:type I restriction enzyme HsdR N-terminal domain-containing protein [Reichenbachiella versicolor]